MRHLLLCCVLTACDASSSTAITDAAADAPPDTPPPFTPETCNGQPITLVATPAWEPVSFGPVTLDAAGTTICLVLDGHVQPGFSYFGAQTALEPGNVSSFVLEVRSESDALLDQGDEIQYGPQVATYAGHAVEPMQLLPIRLVARAKATPVETWIRLSLIVPLD